MTAALQVQGLVAGYGGGRVLHGIDLEVREGEVVAVLGRNGVGKTTLMHSLMGIVRPASGSVRVQGHELAGQPPHQIARHGLALVPQGRRIFGELTVEENLRIAARKSSRARWSLSDVYGLLPRLADRCRNRGDQLSGGEQQMLAIGRALLGNPTLLLLDEPSDGLAPAIVGQITELISSLCTREGLAVVLVEQDLRSAFTLAGTVHVMEKGQLVHSASTADFRRDPDTAKRLLGVGQ